MAPYGEPPFKWHHMVMAPFSAPSGAKNNGSAIWRHFCKNGAISKFKQKVNGDEFTYRHMLLKMSTTNISTIHKFAYPGNSRDNVGQVRAISHVLVPR